MAGAHEEEDKRLFGLAISASETSARLSGCVCKCVCVCESL